MNNEQEPKVHEKLNLIIAKYVKKFQGSMRGGPFKFNKYGEFYIDPKIEKGLKDFANQARVPFKYVIEVYWYIHISRIKTLIKSQLDSGWSRQDLIDKITRLNPDIWGKVNQLTNKLQKTANLRFQKDLEQLVGNKIEELAILVNKSSWRTLCAAGATLLLILAFILIDTENEGDGDSSENPTTEHTPGITPIIIPPSPTPAATLVTPVTLNPNLTPVAPRPTDTNPLRTSVPDEDTPSPTQGVEEFMTDLVQHRVPSIDLFVSAQIMNQSLSIEEIGQYIDQLKTEAYITAGYTSLNAYLDALSNEQNSNRPGLANYMASLLGLEELLSSPNHQILRDRLQIRSLGDLQRVMIILAGITGFNQRLAHTVFNYNGIVMGALLNGEQSYVDSEKARLEANLQIDVLVSRYTSALSEASLNDNLLSPDGTLSSLGVVQAMVIFGMNSTALTTGYNPNAQTTDTTASQQTRGEIERYYAGNNTTAPLGIAINNRLSTNTITTDYAVLNSQYPHFAKLLELYYSSQVSDGNISGIYDTDIIYLMPITQEGQITGFRVYYSTGTLNSLFAQEKQLYPGSIYIERINTMIQAMDERPISENTPVPDEDTPMSTTEPTPIATFESRTPGTTQPIIEPTATLEVAQPELQDGRYSNILNKEISIPEIVSYIDSLQTSTYLAAGFTSLEDFLYYVNNPTNGVLSGQELLGYPRAVYMASLLGIRNILTAEEHHDLRDALNIHSLRDLQRLVTVFTGAVDFDMRLGTAIFNPEGQVISAELLYDTITREQALLAANLQLELLAFQINNSYYRAILDASSENYPAMLGTDNSLNELGIIHSIIGYSTYTNIFRVAYNREIEAFIDESDVVGRNTRRALDSYVYRDNNQYQIARAVDNLIVQGHPRPIDYDAIYDSNPLFDRLLELHNVFLTSENSHDAQFDPDLIYLRPIMHEQAITGFDIYCKQGRFPSLYAEGKQLQPGQEYASLVYRLLAEYNIETAVPNVDLSLEIEETSSEDEPIEAALAPKAAVDIFKHRIQTDTGKPLIVQTDSNTAMQETEKMLKSLSDRDKLLVNIEIVRDIFLQQTKFSEYLSFDDELKQILQVLETIFIKSKVSEEDLCIALGYIYTASTSDKPISIKSEDLVVQNLIHWLSKLFRNLKVNDFKNLYLLARLQIANCMIHSDEDYLNDGTTISLTLGSNGVLALTEDFAT